MELLGKLYPVTGYLLVGAGGGVALERFGLGGAAFALLVEAAWDRQKELEVATRTRERWIVCNELLAEQAGDVTFHEATNRNESGLVPPDGLGSVWPNLKASAHHTRQATTIDRLLDRYADHCAGETINWVHVDCLPALSIIRGAGEQIQHWDVVVARALRDEAGADCPEACQGSALMGHMSDVGFDVVAEFEERHPAIGQFVFVRAWKRELQARNHRQSDAIGALTTTRDAQVTRAACDAAEETCEQARVARATEMVELKLAQALGRAEQLGEELRAEQARSGELSSKVQRLEERVGELTRALDAAQDEANYSRTKLEAELTRAEAQIDLIKSIALK